jgi:hypothetical protein
MTNSNPEIPSEVPPVAAVQPNDNRRRLRELLSVAERDRTDEQWDEIIELEIQLAPGNRIAGNEQGGGADRPQSFHNKPSGGGQPKKHRPRSNNPGGGGGGGGGGGHRRPRQNKPPSGGNPA